jgi:hypothetical protein
MLAVGLGVESNDGESSGLGESSSWKVSRAVSLPGVTSATTFTPGVTAVGGAAVAAVQTARLAPPAKTAMGRYQFFFIGSPFLVVFPLCRATVRGE